MTPKEIEYLTNSIVNGIRELAVNLRATKFEVIQDAEGFYMQPDTEIIRSSTKEDAEQLAAAMKVSFAANVQGILLEEVARISPF